MKKNDNVVRFDMCTAVKPVKKEPLKVSESPLKPLPDDIVIQDVEDLFCLENRRNK